MVNDALRLHDLALLAVVLPCSWTSSMSKFFGIEGVIYKLVMHVLMRPPAYIPCALDCLLWVVALVGLV